MVRRAGSPEAALGGLGAITLAFGGYRLWASGHARSRGSDFAGLGRQHLCGVASGFTSQIAHAGGPPFQIWVLPRRLPRDVLVGTTAIFFAVVNWIKMPAYLALGQFTAENLTTAAVLAPLAIAST